MQALPHILIAVVGLALWSGPAGAQTVYVSRGPDGELSFSDQPGGDVEQVLELSPEPSPLAVPAAEVSAARVTELLRVADALAESRLQRERLRAEQRQPVVPQQVPPQPDYADGRIQQRLWFPPLLAPGPNFRAAGHPGHYGRRYPGDGRYDRRDPRLDNQLPPERAPRYSRPVPP